MNQATALQSLFAGLTDRAMSQNHISSLEIFMRLALKAQSQCRATLETLAAIKNPPVVIARQADKIRQWQPWNKSTGARTAKGKAASSRNAFKGGLRLHIHAMVKSMNVVLREQREGLGRV